MPLYAYRAFTPAGRTRQGVVDAESARAAWQRLRGGGVYPTELREEPPDAGRTLRRPGAAALAAATRQLALLVAAGVPVAEAVAATAEHAVHPSLGRALAGALERLRGGASLAEALGASPRVFPPLYRELVAAGEASGALPAVLERLAAHTEAQAALRARLRAALTYPAIMLAATTAVLGFLLAWVVPEVAALFADTGTPLPLATRVLLAASALARHGWWAVVLGALAGTWAVSRWARTAAGRDRRDALVLAVPGLGRLVRSAATARFARTLATLLEGGVALESALGIAAAALDNRRLAAAVTAARSAVREGEPLAAALGATAEFPPLLVHLAAVGERSGTLAATLGHAAVDAEAEYATAIATVTALVEPAMVLVMGSVVLALVAAVLLPLFELPMVVR